MKAQDEIPGKQQGGDRQCSGKQIQKSDSDPGSRKKNGENARNVCQILRTKE